MPYSYLQHYNQRLIENPELSSHNKEILDDFVEKMEARGTKKSAIGDYISRYKTLAPKINFTLDEPTQAQITKLAGDINKDRVERQRGTVNFSDDSKEKFIKTIKTFYRQFIKKPEEGYIDEIDGKRLVDDVKHRPRKRKTRTKTKSTSTRYLRQKNLPKAKNYSVDA